MKRIPLYEEANGTPTDSEIKSKLKQLAKGYCQDQLVDADFDELVSNMKNHGSFEDADYQEVFKSYCPDADDEDTSEYLTEGVKDAFKKIGKKVKDEAYKALVVDGVGMYLLKPFLKKAGVTDEQIEKITKMAREAGETMRKSSSTLGAIVDHKILATDEGIRDTFKKFGKKVKDEAYQALVVDGVGIYILKPFLKKAGVTDEQIAKITQLAREAGATIQKASPTVGTAVA